MKRGQRTQNVRVAGFRFGAATCGIKASGRPDCAVLVADEPAAAAAVFTRNRFAAAPVIVGREHVRSGRLQALVVNSGNANACTGARGVEDARHTCAAAADALGIAPRLVAPLSTGVIGVPLPMERLRAGLVEALSKARPNGLASFARAIRTTDAYSKIASETVLLGGKRVVVAGVAKGAGMIAPDMATLLVFLLTDAVLTPTQTRLVAQSVAATSFNTLSVDGDTSTNDSLFVLASGRAGNGPVARAALGSFLQAACRVGDRLARLVAADGEGATKTVTIDVSGAGSVAAARLVAVTVARSLLVKTALHGADPNWGRIACAVGYSGAAFDPAQVTIAIGGVPVFRRGGGVSGAAPRARAAMRREEFDIRITLGRGTGTARMITSDLSPAYVRFNSAYST